LHATVPQFNEVTKRIGRVAYTAIWPLRCSNHRWVQSDRRPLPPQRPEDQHNAHSTEDAGPGHVDPEYGGMTLFFVLPIGHRPETWNGEYPDW